MKIVDTSLWVEAIGDGKLARVAKEVLLPLSDCIVPTIVQYEVAKWCNREMSAEKAEAAVTLTTECLVVPLDSAIAIEAAILSYRLKLHTTDAIIYATAQLAGAKLYTSDAHFKGLAGVEYFEK